jgi:hypothetical protein
MDYISNYEDAMDTTENHTEPDSTNLSGENALSTLKLFRTKSLLLATFPWFTVVPMASSKLVENIGDFPESRDIVVR